MKRLFILMTALVALSTVSAQTTKEEVLADLNKAGGVYLAYPVATSENTTPPKGYKPFYISHFGRHGSRYLISAKDYKTVYDLMDSAREAGALSEQGLSLMARLDTIMLEADGHSGDLTRLGTKQHKGIAKRMFKAYPEVFAGNAHISANSTLVPRCILSMAAFTESLKEENPNLDIYRECVDKYVKNIINYNSKEYDEFTKRNPSWRVAYDNFKRTHTNPDRMMNALFTDPEWVRRNVIPADLMWGLYWIAVDLQNMDVETSIYDIFTPDELFDLWQVFNYNWFVSYANSPESEGAPLSKAKPLIRNIMSQAQDAIDGKGNAADLRFGHDGNLVPLAACMRLKDCYNQTSDSDSIYTVFSDFKISPMAGNLQLVFFRNPKTPDDVIVKFMLNERETSIPVETDIYPFYHWKDVKTFYDAIAAE